MSYFTKLVKPLQEAWPWLVSQTEASANAYVTHQEKLAAVEAKKTFLVREAESIAGARDTLRQKLAAASPEERIAIRRDIRSAEEEVRLLGVTAKAFDHFTSDLEKPALIEADNSESEDRVVSGHWIDKFENFARAVNEPWREELLSRALAKEASCPGSISVRALWTLGTLEKQKYDAFMAMLGYCSDINGYWLIVSEYADIESEVYRRLSDVIAPLLWELDETGLVATQGTSQEIDASEFLAKYNDQHAFKVSVDRKEMLRVQGHGPSTLGQEITSICTGEGYYDGVELLHSFLAGISLLPHCRVAKIDGDSKVLCTR